MRISNRTAVALATCLTVIAGAVLTVAVRRSAVVAASPGWSSEPRGDSSATVTLEPARIASSEDTAARESTNVADASSWQEPPRITDPNYPIARLRDMGFRANDAGKFVNPRMPGVVYETDPLVPEAADTLGLLMWRINSCTGRRNSLDACIEHMPLCQTATPWLGDPAGPECLPRECAIAYKEARTKEDDLGAIETMYESHCYPSGPRP